MSFEYRIGGKRKESILEKIAKNVPAIDNDEQELQRLYKNSKFSKTNLHIRDKDREQWVFLSHSNKDFHSVRKLRNFMEEEGQFPLMFFLKCMHDEDELDSLLKREIECRTRFILCDSKNARGSKWVQKEVQVIKALDRIYETINVDNIDSEAGIAQNKIQQLSKRPTLILSFDKEHESLACQMYSRLVKYDFKILLHPLYDFDARSEYECVECNYVDLLDKGFVVALLGEWIAELNNPITRDLFAAINANSGDNYPSIRTIVFESRILELIWNDTVIKNTLSKTLYSYCHVGVQYRVNDAVDGILSRMLTPSSMIVYIEEFKDKQDVSRELFEAGRLTTLLHQNARMDKAGDIASLAKCHEKGWGCEKN